MSTVDDRVVSMKFDNELFQRKMADTIVAIDRLNEKLRLTEGTRGLTEVANATRNFDMNPMSATIDGVSTKFLALATIAITALQRITNAAIDTGKRMATAFTIDPIRQGFAEFETNMNSIQTILANTSSEGTTLQQVNDALDQLNEYSDQTIYNFAQMARNIGTFTAAGVDLDASVNAIKGIANLAAISGSSSEQASTAMYQLSQALAAGRVSLMDWNSVVNAGMGGEVFKKALFETAKAMGTITNVPLTATFEEWEAAGGKFRDQLQSGFITGEVLSTTLSAFSGDLDAAALSAIGFTDAAAAEMIRLGDLGIAAATEVKTMTQLMSTIKESIASGWSQSFRTVIGDFEQSKEIFTLINNFIGGIVGRSADARNQVLEGWASLGGRDVLIQGFTAAVVGLMDVLRPVKEAFREIFPPMTGIRLFELTEGFRNLMMRIQIGEETATKIKNAFRGFFSVLEIGWNIVKGVFGVFGDLLGSLDGAGNGILDFASNTGNSLTRLNEALVAGGGIREFFEKISDIVVGASEKIQDFIASFIGIFSGNDEADQTADSLGRVGDRLESIAGIGDVVAGVIGWLADRFRDILGVLDDVWEELSSWFSDLGANLARTFESGDFNGVVDLINVGLLSGIVVMLRNFLTNGINLDFSNGLFQQIKDSLNGLTETLAAMQAELRARALMKIAIAVGILTVSIVALSMIDSEALTKALTAIAVGFGQLLATMALMARIGPMSVRLISMAAALILIAGAVTVLSVAITILSKLSWEELAKGLIGAAGAMVILAGATRLIAEDTSGLIRAGIAMMFISTALIIFSKALKEFAEMNWEEMAQGLVGVAVGLGVITLAMNNMPTSGMIGAGIGIVLISGALIILSKAVKEFAEMDWATMGKGLAGAAAGLAILTIAVRAMPEHMPLIAAGVLVLSAALFIMAKAVQEMGSMNWEQMVLGIGGLAATLAVLVIAMGAMQNLQVGAFSLLVVSGALVVLAGVLKALGQLSIEELAIGIGAMAAVFAVLAVAAAAFTPLAPGLLSVSVAMVALGVAFALFGVGAMFAAKAFETLTNAGQAGVDILFEIITRLIRELPAMIGAFAEGIVLAITEFVRAIPDMLEGLKEAISAFLQMLVELAPDFAEAFGVMLREGLELLREFVPEFIELGLELLTAFLDGVRDNIRNIVNIVSEIYVEFTSAMTENLPMIVAVAVRFITTFLTELANHTGELVTAGMSLIASFIQGITNNMHMIVTVVTTLITTFITEMGNAAGDLVTAGVTAFNEFIYGLGSDLTSIVTTVADIITEFINSLDQDLGRIADAGFDLFLNFVGGIVSDLTEVTVVVGELVTEFITVLGREASRVVAAGAQALIDFITGVTSEFPRVANAAVKMIIVFADTLGMNAFRLADAAAKLLISFMNAFANAIRENSEQFARAGANIASAIVTGMINGLGAMLQDVINAAVSIARAAYNAVKDFFGIDSPSKLFYALARHIPEGMVLALNQDKTAAGSAKALAERTASTVKETLKRVHFELSEITDTDPVIRPVLDLTKVQAKAGLLSKMMSLASIAPNLSIDKAQLISASTLRDESMESKEPVEVIREVKFEQNITAPTPLTTNDIYRNTKSQITLAKEELSIT